MISAKARERSPSSTWTDILQLFGSVFANKSASRRVHGRSQTAAQNEAQFAMMADRVPAMIWMALPDQQHVYFNKAWLDFTGRSQQEELGMGWFTGIHPSHKEKYLAAYRKAMQERRGFRLTYRLRAANGKYCWVFDVGAPYLDRNGNFAGLVGCCTDLTDSRGLDPEVFELSGLLINAQEEERSRIARELHDNLSQQLALLYLETAQLTQQNRDSDPATQEGWRRILKRMREVSADLHRISHELHPSKLDRLGLVAASKSLCREISQKHGIRLKCIINAVPDSLPRDISLCAYRLIQESLSNIVKHSGACMASVELIGSDAELCLTISDAGIGFDPELVQRKGGLGFISMRERLRLVGAEISIESQPARGTRIRAVIPLVKARSESARR